MTIMANLWEKWGERVILTMAGLVPFVAATAIITYNDVQNLKKLLPIQQTIAKLEERMNACEEQNKAQWRLMREISE